MTVPDILLALTSLGVNAAIVASLRPLTRVETVCISLIIGFLLVFLWSVMQ